MNVYRFANQYKPHLLRVRGVWFVNYHVCVFPSWVLAAVKWAATHSVHK